MALTVLHITIRYACVAHLCKGMRGLTFLAQVVQVVDAVDVLSMDSSAPVSNANE